jgi:phage shock protein A
MVENNSKSFWRRPEGVTGIIFLLGAFLAGGILLVNALPILTQGIMFIASILVLFAIIFTVLDPRARTLVSYGFKSVMRYITGLFVQLDPIAIMRGYVKELDGNLHQMKKQIAQLRGQKHRLEEIIHNNKKQVQSNLAEASQARRDEQQKQMILKSRKASRLRDSNSRLEALQQRMQVLYRVLSKMYENSEILKEDIEDQVEIKEQERKAIHATNSAMKSAMSVISGDPDQRAMFDRAMEAMTEDISNKVGEMERFMQLSANFMNSIDLQNGVFEEEGMKMLEQWEQEGTSLILGDAKAHLLLLDEEEQNGTLDLNESRKEPLKEDRPNNQYDSFFD